MKIIPVQPTTIQQSAAEPSRRTLAGKFRPSRRTLASRFKPSRRTLSARYRG